MTPPARGLAPFDQPVFRSESARLDPEVDETRNAVVLAFVCRAAVVAALSTALPFLTPTDVRVPAAIAIGSYLPATVLLDRRSDGRDDRRIHGALVVIDHAFLVMLCILGDRLEILSTAGLLTVAFHRWLYGRRAGGWSVALLSASVLLLSVDGSVSGDWFTISAVVIVGGLLVWLLDDQLSRHDRVSHRFRLASGRADAVLSGVGEAIVTTGVDGRVRHLNPAANRLFGCSPAAGPGRPCDELAALRRDNRVLSCEQGCALLAEGGHGVEVWRTGRQGERQPLLADAVPLRDEEGSVVEIVHSFRDITALKQADEAKTLFLATASHELKTPLAVIQGFAQLLERDDLEPAARARAVSAIQSRSRELAAIVDRLLMSSRIEAGRIDLQPALQEVGGLVRQRADDVMSSAGRVIHAEVPTELPRVWVDAAAFTTVVDHLLDNALKYSPGGGAIVVRVADDGDDHVVVEVSDEGIGMTEEQLEHCFDRFWQGEGTDVRRFGGTGIGLYIVRSLVHAMDGTVSVDSSAGAGSTFRVRLRCAEPSAAPAEVERPARTEGDGEQSMIREFMRQMGVLETSGEVPR